MRARPYIVDTVRASARGLILTLNMATSQSISGPRVEVLTSVAIAIPIRPPDRARQPEY